MKSVRILVTGGGTGGHVSPALAVVQTLREWAALPNAGFAPTFLYLGSEAGIEARLAREAGLDFASVATGKLRRSSRGLRGLLTAANLRDALRVPVGIGQAFSVVRRFRPDVVLATGGYVSVPPVVAAGLSGVPVLIHEQTATVGLANQIAGRFARRIALSFADTVAVLPANLRLKSFVTGNPVRGGIFGGEQNRGSQVAGFDPADDALPCVYVTGGAQGARVLNRAVEDALPDLLGVCRIIHQCGAQPDGTEQDFDRLNAARAKLPDAAQRRYFITRFVEAGEIAGVFALADLVVGRSGAGTVAEICALGKPAIFVPLQPASGDEQMKNAWRLEKIGAARILPQSECDGAHLLAAMRELAADADIRRMMGAAALTLATPNAARDLARDLLSLAGVTPPFPSDET